MWKCLEWQTHTEAYQNVFTCELQLINSMWALIGRPGQSVKCLYEGFFWAAAQTKVTWGCHAHSHRAAHPPLTQRPQCFRFQLTTEEGGRSFTSRFTEVFYFSHLLSLTFSCRFTDSGLFDLTGTKRKVPADCFWVNIRSVSVKNYKQLHRLISCHFLNHIFTKTKKKKLYTWWWTEPVTYLTFSADGYFHTNFLSSTK